VIGLLEWVIQQSRNDIEKFEDNKIKEWIMEELFDMGEALEPASRDLIKDVALHAGCTQLVWWNQHKEVAEK
jgi:hypothetical protein